MDNGRGADHLLDGWRALEAARWDAARTSFEAALSAEGGRRARGPGSGALVSAAWRRDCRARARVRGVRPRRESDHAARRRLGLAPVPGLGRASAARGWLSRAQRALDGTERCAGHGWAAVERGTPRAWRSVPSTRKRRCPSRGSWMSRISRPRARPAGAGGGQRRAPTGGMHLLEEAMAAASAGRVRNVHARRGVLQSDHGVMSAGEWERAAECAMVDDFARGHDATPLLGACRTAHADVLPATGRWPEAERALESALAAHARYVPAMGAPTVATLAELGCARAACRRRNDKYTRRASVAAASARPPSHRGGPTAGPPRCRTRADGGGGRATELLALLVDARLAAGDRRGAEAAAQKLEELAKTSGIRPSRHARTGSARRPRGRTREPGRRAAPGARRFQPACDAVLDMGRAELARALMGDAPDLARDEARTALAAFRELGARGRWTAPQRCSGPGRDRGPPPQPRRANGARAVACWASRAGCRTRGSRRRWSSARRRPATTSAASSRSSACATAPKAAAYAARAEGVAQAR